VIALGDDGEGNSKELLLNVSIVDIIDNEKCNGSNCYTEVLDFFLFLYMVLEIEIEL